MNSELKTMVAKLAESLKTANPGNIATLAELLGYLENIGALARVEGAKDLIPPTEALGDKLKSMIMGDLEDEGVIFGILGRSVEIMRESVSQDRVPGLTEYPAELKLSEASEGQTASAALPFAADKELLAEYLSEQRNRLEEIEGYLLALEKTEDRTAMGGLKRALHTIKGDSGFLGLSRVAQLAHTAESYLEEASYPYDLECLFSVKDWLISAFEDLTSTDGISQRTVAELARVMASLERHLSNPKAAAPAPVEAAPPQAEEQAPAVVEEPTPSAPEVQEAPDAFATEVESAPAAQAAMEPPPETAQPIAPAYASEPEPAQESAPAAAPAPAADPGFIPATFVGEIPSATPQVAEESSGEGSAEETEQTFRLGGDPSIMVDFVSESKEHLDHASSQLLGLESNPDDEEAINSVFRAFHTIKGVAGFLQLKEIADLAHHTENLLDLVRKHEIQLTPALVDLSFEALDWMNRLIGNVARALGDDGLVRKEPDLKGVIARVQMAQTGTVIPPIAKSPAASASASAATGGTASLGQMLVDKGAITERELEETIMDVEAEGSGKKIGEALVERGKVSASDVHQALRRQQEDRSSRKSVELKETIRVDYERLAGLIDTVGELVLAEAMISQDESLREVKSENLTKKLYNLRQVSRKLQEMGTTIRMVPIAGTFQKMARLVRDLSRKSGKPVNFVSHGDETELDRAYVDLIADPLVHMIRNSMDHGIEMPTERTQQGKPPTGEIILRAFHEGGNIHIEIKDDGKGLDTERIMKKAIERGLVQEGTEMTDQDIFQLIFEPGFSTAEKVTEVSGRGVGMDVVRRNIAELRGQVTISSEKGKGTVFRMILPLTMALIDGMLIRVGEQRFILPVLAVVESTRPTQAMVHTIVGKGEMISLRERQLPLYRLHRLLRINGAKEDATDALVVVVEYESKLYGLMVDELIGIQQTVIKGLDSTVFSTQGFSGSTIMGDGRVGLIIDIPGLLQIARNSADSLAS